MADAIVSFLTIAVPLGFAVYAFIEILKGNIE